MVLISIIVPVYQAESWIAETIESVIGQTYKNIELLLLDDGSSDSSGDICDRFAQKYKWIKVVHKKNEGVSQTRNKGMHHSSGKYLMFLDSDDTLEKDAVECAVEVAEQNCADIVIFDFYKETNQKQIEVHKTDLEEGLYLKSDLYKIIPAMIDSNTANNIGTKLYNRKMIEKIQFNNDFSICEDIAFFLNTMKYAQTIYYLDRCFYCYKVRNVRSLMHSYKKNYYEAIKYMQAMFLELLGHQFHVVDKWFFLFHMKSMRGALENAIMIDRKQYSILFDKVYNDNYSKLAKLNLKNNEYWSDLPFKSKIIFWLIWFRHKWILHLLFEIRK